MMIRVINFKIILKSYRISHDRLMKLMSELLKKLNVIKQLWIFEYILEWGAAGVTKRDPVFII